MTVEGIGPVDPVQRFSKTNKIQKTNSLHAGDSISVSSEAKERAELMQAIDEVRRLPDIRQDRVAEVKSRLEDPSYINDAVIGAVADSILSVFDIE